MMTNSSFTSRLRGKLSVSITSMNRLLLRRSKRTLTLAVPWQFQWWVYCTVIVGSPSDDPITNRPPHVERERQTMTSSWRSDHCSRIHWTEHSLVALTSVQTSNLSSTNYPLTSLWHRYHSDGARTSRQPGHFQLSKVVRQAISCEGPKDLRTRPVSSEGSGITSSRPNYWTYVVNIHGNFSQPWRKPGRYIARAEALQPGHLTWRALVYRRHCAVNRCSLVSSKFNVII